MSPEFRQVPAEMACFCSIYGTSAGRLKRWRLKPSKGLFNLPVYWLMMDVSLGLTCGYQLEYVHMTSSCGLSFFTAWCLASKREHLEGDKEPGRGNSTFSLIQCQKLHSITSSELYWSQKSQTLPRSENRDHRTHLSMAQRQSRCKKSTGNGISILVQLFVKYSLP